MADGVTLQLPRHCPHTGVGCRESWPRAEWPLTLFTSMVVPGRTAPQALTGEGRCAEARRSAELGAPPHSPGRSSPVRGPSCRPGSRLLLFLFLCLQAVLGVSPGLPGPAGALQLGCVPALWWPVESNHLNVPTFHFHCEIRRTAFALASRDASQLWGGFKPKVFPLAPFHLSDSLLSLSRSIRSVRLVCVLIDTATDPSRSDEMCDRVASALFIADGTLVNLGK